MSSHESIATKQAPAAIGTYSQAIKAGNTVYLSGQIPLDPATMELVEGDIVAQAIDHELKRSGEDCVYLDISEKPASEIRQHFPFIHDNLKERFQIDMTKLARA